MNTVLVPLPDGRWLALDPQELHAATTRAEAMGFGSISAPAPRPSAPAQLLDSKAMAARLGVADTWVEQAAKSGEIPSLRVGRYLRFDAAAVLQALAHQKALFHQKST